MKQKHLGETHVNIHIGSEYANNNHSFQEININRNYDSHFNDQIFKKFKGPSVRNVKKRHMSASHEGRLLYNQSSSGNLINQINRLNNNSVSINGDKVKSINIKSLKDTEQRYYDSILAKTFNQIVNGKSEKHKRLQKLEKSKQMFELKNYSPHPSPNAKVKERPTLSKK